MKWLLSVITALFLCMPASATWTVVQAKSNSCGSTNACAVTVSSTGAGHVLVIFFNTDTSTTTISSVTGGGTWTLCGSTCHVGNVSSGYMDPSSTLSSPSGATTITANLSATASSNTGYVFELSSTATYSFDVA